MEMGNVEAWRDREASGFGGGGVVRTSKIYVVSFITYWTHEVNVLGLESAGVHGIEDLVGLAGDVRRRLSFSVAMSWLSSVDLQFLSP